MKAIVSDGSGGIELTQIDVPTAGPEEILIKVVAAGQNPADWIPLSWHMEKVYVLGCDFAGTIVSIGSLVPAGLRKIGERVAGFVHGGTGYNDTVSFEHGAQLGIACYTACQALYQGLDLPTPLNPISDPTDILVWSGTSAVGQYIVQFAKLAGFRVISTASLKNIELVKSLGADEVFDYEDPQAPAKIFAATGGNLRYAVDCICVRSTPDQVAMSMSEEGGKVAVLLPYEIKRENVTTVFNVAYTIFEKDIDLPLKLPGYPSHPKNGLEFMTIPRNREHHENGVKYAQLVSEIIAKYSIKPVPIKIYPHGLASVGDGFEYMRAGKVHAEKITYRIADTPGL